MKRSTILLGVAAVMLSLLGACAAVQYELPAVGGASDGQKRPGKFIWHDLISDDPAGSEAFFSALFGWEFRSLAPLGANYWVISLAGEPIGGMVRQDVIGAARDISQWVSVLSVVDPAATRTAAASMGAEVLREPVSLGERGTIAVYADPQGAIFAALTTPAGDPIDSAELPAEGAFIWHELWTPDVEAAASFYRRLGSLEVARRPAVAGEDGGEFALLLDGDEMRAGVRPLPAPDMPPLWMPYLRVESLDRLEQFLARVPQLGGEVLVPSQPRPAGGFVAVIADPSGAPLALQTWSGRKPSMALVSGAAVTGGAQP